MTKLFARCMTSSIPVTDCENGCRRYRDKLVVVTGSTAGIGLQIALRMGLEGGTIVVSSRKDTNVRKAVAVLRAQGVHVYGMVCHIAKPKDREELLRKSVSYHPKAKGKIDVLVSNVASSTSMALTIDTPEEAWSKMFYNNVIAGFLLIQQAVAQMDLISAGSAILIISSYLAYSPSPPIGVYGITKTALLGMTKALATELGPHGIRVNAIAPGVVKTDFSRGLWDEHGTDDTEGARASGGDNSVSGELLKQIPLGRFARAEEIAGPAAMLCSNDGTYITGEVLVVAGGMNSRL